MPAELAVTATPSGGDRLLQAEALVRSYCRWHIAPAREDALTIADCRDYVIVLPTLRLNSVTSLAVGGVAVEDYAFATAGYLTRFDVWRDLWRASRGPVVEVMFNHGYATPPPEVTAVVQAVASRAAGNPGSLIREQVGPFTSTYSQTGKDQAAALALLDSEKRTLDAYRLPSRP